MAGEHIDILQDKKKNQGVEGGSIIIMLNLTLYFWNKNVQHITKDDLRNIPVKDVKESWGDGFHGHWLLSPLEKVIL